MNGTPKQRAVGARSKKKSMEKKMRKKTILLFAAFAFTVSGCTSPAPKSEQSATGGPGVGTPSGVAPSQPIAGEKIGEYMDKQEQELNLRLANEEGASVRRFRDHLSITFGSDLLFDVDSVVLRAGAIAEINRVAEVLKKYPQTRVRVNGFTDSTGSEQHNLELSRKRATAVMEVLVHGGISPKRIRAQGFGESRPVRSNATDSGRRQNRRVTVVVIPSRS